MADPSGCFGLLLAPFRALSGPRALQLPGARTLPPLRLQALHPKERPLVARAHASAVAALKALLEPGADGVRRDVAETVVALYERVQALALGLSKARALLKRDDPDRLAKERTALELRLLEADLGARKGLQESLDRLDERRRQAQRVRSEVETSRSRLEACTETLATLRSRVEREGSLLGPLREELQAQQQETSRAVEAFEATLREVG